MPGREPRSLLDSLDAAGRRAPAYLHLTQTGRDEIVTRYNSDYFDDSLPRYVPQVLAVDVHLIDLVPPADDPRLRRNLARLMLETTDWRRMAGELMQ